MSARDGRGLVRQIRQNTEWRISGLQAVAVLYSFTAGALGSGLELLFVDPWAIPRLLIPATAVLLVLLLRNGYAAREPGQLAPIADVALAAAMAFATERLLDLVQPALVLSLWAPTQGGLAGWINLMLLRALFKTEARREMASTSVMLADIRWKVQELQRAMRQRRAAASSVGVLAAILCTKVVLSGAYTQEGRLAAALMIGGVAWMLWQVYRLGESATTSSESDLRLYRDELERESKFFRCLWHGCWGFLLPAVLLMLAGSRVYEYFCLLYLLLAAEVVLRAKERAQREREQLA